MNKLTRIHGLVLVILLLASLAFAQTAALPRFKKNESYKSVRVKLLKAGWKPYHAEDSDVCGEGDKRCQGRPEMHVCAGTGLGNCEFLWKRKGKTVEIFTVGEEDNTYSGHRFE